MAMVIGNRVRNGDLEDLMVLSVMVAAVCLGSSWIGRNSLEKEVVGGLTSISVNGVGCCRRWSRRIERMMRKSLAVAVAGNLWRNTVNRRAVCGSLAAGFRGSRRLIGGGNMWEMVGGFRLGCQLMETTTECRSGGRG